MVFGNSKPEHAIQILEPKKPLQTKIKEHLLALSGDSIIVCNSSNLISFLDVSNECSSQVNVCGHLGIVGIGPCTNDGNITGIRRDYPTVLPSEIGLLSNLNQLALGYSSFTFVIPSEIGLLSKLQTLYLFSIGLRVLPSEIGLLSNLQFLSLAYNQLTALPSEIGLLSNLQELRLSSNQLTCLPSEISLLSNLVSYDNNPIDASQVYCKSTYLPSQEPTVVPSSSNPSYAPTMNPSHTPTFIPTIAPTVKLSFKPTSVPTNRPSFQPTSKPTFKPTKRWRIGKLSTVDEQHTTSNYRNSDDTKIYIIGGCILFVFLFIAWIFYCCFTTFHLPTQIQNIKRRFISNCCLITFKYTDPQR